MINEKIEITSFKLINVKSVEIQDMCERLIETYEYIKNSSNRKMYASYYHTLHKNGNLEEYWSGINSFDRIFLKQFSILRIEFIKNNYKTILNIPHMRYINGREIVQDEQHKLFVNAIEKFKI